MIVKNQCWTKAVSGGKENVVALEIRMKWAREDPKRSKEKALVAKTPKWW